MVWLNSMLRINSNQHTSISVYNQYIMQLYALWQISQLACSPFLVWFLYGINIELGAWIRNTAWNQTYSTDRCHLSLSKETFIVCMQAQLRFYWGCDMYTCCVVLLKHKLEIYKMWCIAKIVEWNISNSFYHFMLQCATFSGIKRAL